MPHIPLILADIGDVIFIVVVIAFSVIGAIAKAREESAKRRASSAEDTAESASERSRKYRELAERRRREVQELARQRQEQAEARRREIRERAEQARLERQQPRQTVSRVDIEPPARPRPVAPPPPPRVTRTQPQSRSQRQAPPAPRPAPARVRQREQARVAPPAVAPGQPGHEGDTVHRHVTNAASTAYDIKAPEVPLVGKLDRQTLRQAVILKEILSPPLSLLDPLTDPMER